MASRALRRPIELFLPNSNERCVLTFLVEVSLLPDGEHVALMRGFKEAIKDEDGKDLFMGGNGRAHIFADMYMPRSVFGSC